MKGKNLCLMLLGGLMSAFLLAGCGGTADSPGGSAGSGEAPAPKAVSFEEYVLSKGKDVTIGSLKGKVAAIAESSPEKLMVHGSLVYDGQGAYAISDDPQKLQRLVIKEDALEATVVESVEKATHLFSFAKGRLYLESVADKKSALTILENGQDLVPAQEQGAPSDHPSIVSVSPNGQEAVGSYTAGKVSAGKMLGDGKLPGLTAKEPIIQFDINPQVYAQDQSFFCFAKNKGEEKAVRELDYSGKVLRELGVYAKAGFLIVTKDYVVVVGEYKDKLYVISRQDGKEIGQIAYSDLDCERAYYGTPLGGNSIAFVSKTDTAQITIVSLDGK